MVRAFSILVIFCALSTMIYMCFQKGCRGLNIRINIFMSLSVESTKWLAASLSFGKCSAGCGGNDIVCIFCGV